MMPSTIKRAHHRPFPRFVDKREIVRERERENRAGILFGCVFGRAFSRPKAAPSNSDTFSRGGDLEEEEAEEDPVWGFRKKETVPRKNSRRFPPLSLTGPRSCSTRGPTACVFRRLVLALAVSRGPSPRALPGQAERRDAPRERGRERRERREGERERAAFGFARRPRTGSPSELRQRPVRSRRARKIHKSGSRARSRSDSRECARVRWVKDPTRAHFFTRACLNQPWWGVLDPNSTVACCEHRFRNFGGLFPRPCARRLLAARFSKVKGLTLEPSWRRRSASPTQIVKCRAVVVVVVVVV